MALQSTILENLPSHIPKSDIRVDEEHQFEYINDSTPRTVYQLKKAPFERVITVDAVVHGIQQELELGSEVEVRDTNDDGELDSIAFVDMDRYPDRGTSFTVTYVCEPIISRYIGTYDSDLNLLSERIDANPVESKSVNTASGEQLDLLGQQYGELGQRRGRPDSEYRGVLRSLVSASTGRGTVSDIQFSIATAVGTEPENVTIREDFDEVGYSISVDDPNSSVEMASLVEVIDLTRPSGVKLLRNPVFFGTDITVHMDAGGSSYTVVQEGLGTGTLGEDTLE